MSVVSTLGITWCCPPTWVRCSAEASRSVATKAIIVRVFPSPIVSAMIPPRNSAGSSSWYTSATLLMKLKLPISNADEYGFHPRLTKLHDQFCGPPKDQYTPDRKPNHARVAA